MKVMVDENRNRNRNQRKNKQKENIRKTEEQKAPKSISRQTLLIGLWLITSQQKHSRINGTS